MREKWDMVIGVDVKARARQGLLHWDFNISYPCMGVLYWLSMSGRGGGDSKAYLHETSGS